MDEAAFLQRLRRPRSDRAGHPGSYRARDAGPVSWERFRAVLETVGGSAHAEVTSAGVPAAVSAIIEIGRHARVVASEAAAAMLPGVPGVSRLAEAATAHSCADIDLAIVVPELAVCENAALLLSSDSLPERSLLFLAQHVLVLLDTALLVADQHLAAGAMRHGQSQSLPHHLTWISGPSKTADIEQTLVIGAHGCRSLLVQPYAR